MAKVDPYLRPLYDALYDMVEPEGAQRLLERQTVEVAPLAFMRGRTLNRSFIILDEAQNTTPEQMKMFLTRIGFGSKVVVTGDITQVDVPGGRSGLVGLERVLTGIDGLAFVHLTSADVVRHRIVADIVAAYERAGEPAARRTVADPARPRLAGADGSAATATPEVFVADEQADVAGRRRRAGRALAEAVLARRGRARRRRAVAAVRRRGRRSPSSTSGSWARRARPTCSRSRSTTTDVEVGRWPDRGDRGPDRAPPDPGDLPLLLGDVVICPAVAARQAPEHAGTVDDELALLVVHGILHVLGHDHADRPRTQPRCAPGSEPARAAPLARPAAPAGFRQEQS